MGAEHRLYDDVAGPLALPVSRPGALRAQTRIVDAEVARAIGTGVDQIVLVGAGYDGRALRFGGGAVRWFEVDRAPAQAEKRRRLAALGTEPHGVTYAAADLVTDDVGAALDGSGHDPTRPSLFVCERALASLTLETAASLCAALRARAAPASALVASFPVAPVPGAPVRVVRGATDAWRRVVGEPTRHELRPGDPEKLMVVTGWRVTQAVPSARSRLDPGAHVLVLVGAPR